jgi:hypothetical protein
MAADGRSDGRVVAIRGAVIDLAFDGQLPSIDGAPSASLDPCSKGGPMSPTIPRPPPPLLCWSFSPRFSS